jgi:hypothetical protein
MTLNWPLVDSVFHPPAPRFKGFGWLSASLGIKDALGGAVVGFKRGLVVGFGGWPCSLRGPGAFATHACSAGFSFGCSGHNDALDCFAWHFEGSVCAIVCQEPSGRSPHAAHLMAPCDQQRNKPATKVTVSTEDFGLTKEPTGQKRFNSGDAWSNPLAPMASSPAVAVAPHAVPMPQASQTSPEDMTKREALLES